MHPYLLTQLVSERRTELLARAERSRLASTARAVAGRRIPLDRPARRAPAAVGCPSGL